MLEGYRPIRVEESPEEIEAAGYSIGVDEKTHGPITDAPVDWGPNDPVRAPLAGTPVADTPSDIPFVHDIPDIPVPDPPKPPEKPAEKELSAAETQPPPPDPEKKLSVDDVWKESFEEPEQPAPPAEGEVPADDQPPAPDQPAPDEPPTAEERDSITPGKDKLGKFTQAEFDETKLTVTLLHHGMQNGNAWLMQQITGEGELNEYKAFNKQYFDIWTELGTQLCAKYGIKPPLEVSYLTAAGVNLGPAWGMAWKIRAKNKKLKEQEDKIQKLTIENFLLNNPGLIEEYHRTGKVPSPPPNYTAQKPPVQPPVPDPFAGQQAAPDPEPDFANDWQFNPGDNFWYHVADASKKYPAIDGDYIFSPERGMMIHKLTGKSKIGRTKGKVDTTERAPVQRYANGQVVGRKLKSGKPNPDWQKWVGMQPK